MADFWRKLTELISQYTVADTACVFAIVEGFATVVAAIGAIIAIALTKKIANKQIEIAKKQNEISAAQVELSKQQNSISLYQKREETFDYFTNFVSHWRGVCELILIDFDIDNVKKCRMFIAKTNEHFLKKELSPTGDDTDYIIVNYEMVGNDAQSLLKLGNLITKEPQILDYMMDLIKIRQSIASTMSAILKRVQPAVSLEENAKAFLKLLDSAKANEIFSMMVYHLAMDMF